MVLAICRVNDGLSGLDVMTLNWQIFNIKDFYEIKVLGEFCIYQENRVVSLPNKQKVRVRECPNFDVWQFGYGIFDVEGWDNRVCYHF